MPSFIVSFGFSKPRFVRGTLHGEGKIPITILHLGIVSFINLGDAHVQAFKNMMEAGGVSRTGRD